MNQGTENESAKPSRGKGLWKPLLLLGLVFMGLVLAKVLKLDQHFLALRPWIASLGPWGPLVYIGLYISAAIVAVPGSVLTVAAGVLFGSVWGVIWASLASTLAATVCFLISRYFARSALESSMQDQPQFQRLDALTRNNGALIVAITRLLPIFPFNLLNYGFGLTSVSLGAFVLMTWVCMLPVTVLLVVGSDVVKQAFVNGQIPWPLVAVVVGMIVLMALIGQFARKKLKEAEQKASLSSEDE